MASYILTAQEAAARFAGRKLGLSPVDNRTAGWQPASSLVQSLALEQEQELTQLGYFLAVLYSTPPLSPQDFEPASTVVHQPSAFNCLVETEGNGGSDLDTANPSTALYLGLGLRQPSKVSDLEEMLGCRPSSGLLRRAASGDLLDRLPSLAATLEQQPSMLLHMMDSQATGVHPHDLPYLLPDILLHSSSLNLLKTFSSDDPLRSASSVQLCGVVPAYVPAVQLPAQQQQACSDSVGDAALCSVVDNDDASVSTVQVKTTLDTCCPTLFQAATTATSPSPPAAPACETDGCAQAGGAGGAPSPLRSTLSCYATADSGQFEVISETVLPDLGSRAAIQASSTLTPGAATFDLINAPQATSALDPPSPVDAPVDATIQAAAAADPGCASKVVAASAHSTVVTCHSRGAKQPVCSPFARVATCGEQFADNWQPGAAAPVQPPVTPPQPGKRPEQIAVAASSQAAVQAEQTTSAPSCLAAHQASARLGSHRSLTSAAALNVWGRQGSSTLAIPGCRLLPHAANLAHAAWRQQRLAWLPWTSPQHHHPAPDADTLPGVQGSGATYPVPEAAAAQCELGDSAGGCQASRFPSNLLEVALPQAVSSNTPGAPLSQDVRDGSAQLWTQPNHLMHPAAEPAGPEPWYTGRTAYRHGQDTDGGLWASPGSDSAVWPGAASTSCDTPHDLAASCHQPQVYHTCQAEVYEQQHHRLTPPPPPFPPPSSYRQHHDRRPHHQQGQSWSPSRRQFSQGPSHGAHVNTWPYAHCGDTGHQLTHAHVASSYHNPHEACAVPAPPASGVPAAMQAPHWLTGEQWGAPGWSCAPAAYGCISYQPSYEFGYGLQCAHQPGYQLASQQAAQHTPPHRAQFQSDGDSSCRMSSGGWNDGHPGITWGGGQLSQQASSGRHYPGAASREPTWVAGQQASMAGAGAWSATGNRDGARHGTNLMPAVQQPPNNVHSSWEWGGAAASGHGTASAQPTWDAHTACTYVRGSSHDVTVTPSARPPADDTRLHLLGTHAPGGGSRTTPQAAAQTVSPGGLPVWGCCVQDERRDGVSPGQGGRGVPHSWQQACHTSSFAGPLPPSREVSPVAAGPGMVPAGCQWGSLDVCALSPTHLDAPCCPDSGSSLQDAHATWITWCQSDVSNRRTPASCTPAEPGQYGGRAHGAVLQQTAPHSNGSAVSGGYKAALQVNPFDQPAPARGGAGLAAAVVGASGGVVWAEAQGDTAGGGLMAHTSCATKPCRRRRRRRRRGGSGWAAGLLEPGGVVQEDDWAVGEPCDDVQ